VALDYSISTAVSLRAAARDFLFLGRGRCCGGGAQNNGSGQRKYRTYRKTIVDAASRFWLPSIYYANLSMMEE